MASESSGIPPRVSFVGADPARIDQSDIDRLKADALARPDRHARLCLHPTLEDAVHEMVLVHCRGAYVPPHKHEVEMESFLVLEGEMEVVFFDDSGAVTECFRMGERSSGRCCFCRIGPGRWHTMIPLSDTVVFLETTQGPFRGAAHNTFAEWAPKPDDAPGVERFMRTLTETE